jgi:hypothetical protein
MRYVRVFFPDGTDRDFIDVPDEDPYMVARHDFRATESGALVIELLPPSRAQDAGVYFSLNVAAYNQGSWSYVRAITDEC